MYGVGVQGVDFLLVSLFFRSFGGIGVNGQFVLPYRTCILVGIGAGILSFVLQLFHFTFLFMLESLIGNRLDSRFVFLKTTMELVILIFFNFIFNTSFNISERTQGVLISFLL